MSECHHVSFRLFCLCYALACVFSAWIENPSLAAAAAATHLWIGRPCELWVGSCQRRRNCTTSLFALHPWGFGTSENGRTFASYLWSVLAVAISWDGNSMRFCCHRPKSAASIKENYTGMENEWVIQSGCKRILGKANLIDALQVHAKPSLALQSNGRCRQSRLAVAGGAAPYAYARRSRECNGNAIPIPARKQLLSKMRWK